MQAGMIRQKYQLSNFNWVLFIAVITISIMGVVFINSADSTYMTKQLFGLIFCGIIMVLLAFVNYNFLSGFSQILYIINIVMLVIVKLFGVRVGGARRWLNLGFTRLQPSEFTKVIMIIFVAVYIQDHEDDFNEPKVLARLALLCAVPILLILSEPDLSTTLDIIFILLAVIFAGRLRTKIIRNCILIAVPLAILFLWYIQTPGQILLKDYQVTRIMSFINPSEYASTGAYQQDNSVMAIGSGQLYGKGLRNNTISDVSVTVTQSGLVSEQQTDFIFSVVGEELGFVGSLIIIGLFLVIVMECLWTAYWARNLSGQLISVGMAALIGFQSFINIGVATAILPNTGLPLPFVSYGLTSLLSCMAGIGIVLNIGLQKRY